MKNISGPPVDGKNFFGRKKKLQEMHILLEDHDLLLLGPRRIGKTSIARKIMEEKVKDGWRAVEINVASCNDERALLEKMTKDIGKKFSTLKGRAQKKLAKSMEAIRNEFKSITLSYPDAPSLKVDLQHNVKDWTSMAESIVSLFGQIKEPVLIYMDELPIFLYNLINNDKDNGAQRVRRFLDWFRNDIRSLPGASRISWLVSGSVGLDTLTQTYGMADTINTFQHCTLDAFQPDEAVEFLGCLSKNYGIDLQDAELLEIVNLIRWAQPYYLQSFFNSYRALLASEPDKTCAHLFNEVIEGMAKPGSDNDFHHWEKRLSIQLPSKDAGHALFLLERTCHDQHGVQAGNLLVQFQEREPNLPDEEAKREFIRLRDILIRDAYWQVDEIDSAPYYSFRLEPLRRWWRRRNSL